MLLVELNLYRGPRPKDMLELKTAGIETIINLEAGIFELFNNDAYEREFPSDYGIQEYPIKCSDIWWPSKWAVDTAIRVILRGRKTYIHCKTGKDRTGWMIMMYRMRIDNWTPERAYAEWVRMGRHPWYDWWKYSLKSR